MVSDAKKGIAAGRWAFRKLARTALWEDVTMPAVR
jgi:hypothetical protein